ncbi:MAG: hypothetical protein ACR2K1_08360 [Saprospiraceae bacterium]
MYREICREFCREFWRQFNFNCLAVAVIMIAGALALVVVYVAGRY